MNLSLKIALPWPYKHLSPNARAHWRAVATAKKQARDGAYWAVMEYIAPAHRKAFGTGNTIPVTITFWPPDARHRDLDNCIASLKAAQDGIAKALGVDDRLFAPEYRWGHVEKPGKVIVEIGLPTLLPNEMG